jgi:hypothetical protein
MYVTILKLFLPYLQRFAAKRTAEYLQARREQRIAKQQTDQVKDLPTSPVCLPAETNETSSRQAWWLAVSGLLLGGVCGYALAYLTHRKN